MAKLTKYEKETIILFTDVIELVPDEPASTGGKEHERIETKNNRKRN